MLRHRRHADCAAAGDGKNFSRQLEMAGEVKYTIFETQWGYFGLAGTEKGLLRTCLPAADPKKIESSLLKNLPSPRYDKTIFKAARQQIATYFEGRGADFAGEIAVVLDGLSLFGKKILQTCRSIKFGQTISYRGLAKRAGRPNAARAVGGALARNPLPLIIPCHRVIRSDGSVGDFSAAGGAELKKKMLRFERKKKGDGYPPCFV